MTSRSTGMVFASTFRWRMTTPFGSAVAPDVKMIWMMSSRVTAASGIGPSARQSRSDMRHTAACGADAAVAGSGRRTSFPISMTRASTRRVTRSTNSADDR
jgi:hypothetical protein